MIITEADLDRWFTYHPPTPEQQAKYDRITAATRAAAEAVLLDEPDGLDIEDFFERLDYAIEDVCLEGDERNEAFECVADARQASRLRSMSGARRALMHLRGARMWANAAIACAAPSPAIEPAPPPAEAAASELVLPVPAPAMLCPRRAENGVMPGGPFNVPDADSWHPERNTCSWCGSLNPDEAMRRILAGAEVEPTDKDYKIYLRDDAGSAKFYFQHLSTEQRIAFVEEVNAGKVKFAYPGHFYVLPFFMRKSTASESTEAAR